VELATAVSQARRRQGRVPTAGRQDAPGDHSGLVWNSPPRRDERELVRRGRRPSDSARDRMGTAARALDNQFGPSVCSRWACRRRVQVLDRDVRSPASAYLIVAPSHSETARSEGCVATIGRCSRIRCPPLCFGSEQPRAGSACCRPRRASDRGSAPAAIRLPRIEACCAAAAMRPRSASRAIKGAGAACWRAATSAMRASAPISSRSLRPGRHPSTERDVYKSSTFHFLAHQSISVVPPAIYPHPAAGRHDRSCSVNASRSEGIIVVFARWPIAATMPG